MQLPQKSPQLVNRREAVKTLGKMAAAVLGLGPLLSTYAKAEQAIQVGEATIYFKEGVIGMDMGGLYRAFYRAQGLSVYDYKVDKTGDMATLQFRTAYQKKGEIYLMNLSTINFPIPYPNIAINTPLYKMHISPLTSGRKVKKKEREHLLEAYYNTEPGMGRERDKKGNLKRIYYRIDHTYVEIVPEDRRTYNIYMVEEKDGLVRVGWVWMERSAPWLGPFNIVPLNHGTLIQPYDRLPERVYVDLL